MRYILFLIILLFSFEIKAEESICALVKVIDGDTIKVKINGENKNVRLTHIDAPELKQPYGQDAKCFLTGLMCNRKKLIVMWTKLDKYGRILGDVYVDDFCVNIYMVNYGYAWHYPFGKLNGMDEVIIDMQAYAKKSKIGLWADDNSIHPSE